MPRSGLSQDASSIANAPYRLESLLDIALSPHVDGTAAHITCLDYWDANLYIGTSAGELVHYVLLPAENGASELTWIQGSQRFLGEEEWPKANDTAVRQVVLLPSVNKACILYNETVTFYTLPELTPTFTSTKLNGCSHVGGVDLDVNILDSTHDGVEILICQRSRLRIVKVGERASRVTDIEYGGCVAAVRRGDIACVADNMSYSLLDVVQKQRIPLVNVSSIEELTDGNLGTESDAPVSTMQDEMPGAGHLSKEFQHEKNEASPAAKLEATAPAQTSPSDLFESNQREIAGSGQQGSSSGSSILVNTHTAYKHLRPIVASPGLAEFLVAQGTSTTEQGLGMFVNADGDPYRSTIQFQSFPSALCIDSGDSERENSKSCYVLAVVNACNDDTVHKVIEVIDLDSDDAASHLLSLGTPNTSKLAEEQQPCLYRAGARSTTGTLEHDASEAIHSLHLIDLVAPRASDEPSHLEIVDTNEEESAVVPASKSKISMFAWNENKIWGIVKNSMVTIAESRLAAASDFDNKIWFSRTAVRSILQDLESLEITTEMDFFSLTYIRQKGSLMLFVDLVLSTHKSILISEKDRRDAFEALCVGEVDPRLVLLLTPRMGQEVMWAGRTFRVRFGLASFINKVLRLLPRDWALESRGENGLHVLQLIKQYLSIWRGKKGFGSVGSDARLFQTVDAALIGTLLILDSYSPRGPAKRGTIRSELNAVVDGGVDCFEEVAKRLNDSKRLYVLSRLYQSRKMSKEVLATWVRILEGEEDLGGELVDGENEMRRYLANVRDPTVVKQYGSWLARRNPDLGARLFADDIKVRLLPQDTVALLRQEAPESVRIFLEHLVFDKNLIKFADDLMNLYVDAVLEDIEHSATHRDSLRASYELYRSLTMPKPTYIQFAAEQGLETNWWRNRLRLLELLGGTNVVASSYDVPGILVKLKTYEKELVPEMIVLASKQGQFEKSIQLLIHELGDYDTAVSFCLAAGASTYTGGAKTLTNGQAPSVEQQQRLFKTLLDEFLSLRDAQACQQHASELLERFAGWFDPVEVIAKLPDSWPLGLVSSFLETSVRQLVASKNETRMTRALASVDNLAASVSLIHKREKFSARVQSVELDVESSET